MLCHSVLAPSCGGAGPPLDGCMSLQHFSHARVTVAVIACCMLCSCINRGSCSIRPGSYTATMTGGIFALVRMRTQLTHCTITRNGSIMRRSYPAIFVLNPLSFITFIEFENNSVCAKLELICTERNFTERHATAVSPFQLDCKLISKDCAVVLKAHETNILRHLAIIQLA